MGGALFNFSGAKLPRAIITLERVPLSSYEPDLAAGRASGHYILHTHFCFFVIFYSKHFLGRSAFSLLRCRIFADLALITQTCDFRHTIIL